MTKSTTHLTCESREGPEVRVPVATVEGAADGPTLLVVAGVHGSEYVGLEAVKRLHRSVNPDHLSGRLVTVPCFGLPAFYGFSTHLSPIDGLNPARVFPGDADGSHTERAARLVWDHLVADADVAVDVHGGDLEEELTEYTQVDLTGDSAVDEASVALARSFGFPLMVKSPPKDDVPSKGNFFSQVALAGKPAVLTEAGSHGILDTDLVDWYHTRLADGLRGLGMLPGEPSGVDDPQVLHRFGGAYAPMDGCWFPSVVKGDRIAEGQVIGEMRDIFGEHLTVVHSPADAVVLGVMTIPARPEGSMLLGYATVEP